MESKNELKTLPAGSILEASLNSLLTIGKAGKIIAANEPSIKAMGTTRAHLIGSEYADYFTEPREARKYIKLAFESSEGIDFTLTLKHRDGGLKNVLIHLAQFADEFGRLEGVYAATRELKGQECASNLGIANRELAFQNNEKDKRAAELLIANEELAFQNCEKERRSNELLIANKELAFQNDEKERRAAELVVANTELAFESKEKEKRADELQIANKELAFQNNEKEKRAAELVIANHELAFESKEKEKRADELLIANKELAYQNHEKEKRAAELVLANSELDFQNDEKEKRAQELSMVNKELAYQNDEREKRAAELVLANSELDFQNDEKKKRARELNMVNQELAIQNEENIKFAAELIIANYTRSLIEASRDPLFTISPNGIITDTNVASVLVTDVTRDKLIGSHFIDYFTEPEKAKQVYEEVFSEGFIVDSPLTIKDGKLSDVLFNGSVYKDKDGKVNGAVVVARDITEQKRNENEFVEARIFAEFATTLAEDAKLKAENATLIAQNAVKAKQQFLSNMSHEIRTPMNAIIGFTKVVLKTELNAKQKEYLTAIKMSGDALIILINDILDLAKVDAGKMTFEQTPFKMALSIAAMMHLFESKIQEKNLKFEKVFDKNIPEVLVGDAVRLHQIIINLLSNAVKFTHEGKITIGTKLISEDKKKVSIEFTVTDTGVGISSSKLEKIFENFQQASSDTSRLYGGTGLGLAIVKQLVESQTGSITVQSELNKGSTFTFVLPFQKTTEKMDTEITQRELNTDKKNIKVLVVEDIVLNQLLMKTLLDDFGFECDIAGNGKLAIAKLISETYNIILMDLQMPEMNGFETTKYIRDILHSQIPIIALTADVTTVDLAKCKAVGMNDYISKPVDERLLYHKIISFVKTSNPVVAPKHIENQLLQNSLTKCTNLDYLKHRTKSNTELMIEMIQAYLDQTPTLIAEIKSSLQQKNWKSIETGVHKMLPSFSIVGIDVYYEKLARRLKDMAQEEMDLIEIPDLVVQLEQLCTQACHELEADLIQIKNNKNGKR